MCKSNMKGEMMMTFYEPKMGAHMWLYALKLLELVLDIRIKHSKHN